jgi:DNA-binding NtrC family response regulator
MPPRVLVIEDEPLLQRLLRRMLAPHCNVRIACSVDEALDELRILEFDVVVADLELGERDRDGRWLLAEVEQRSPATRRLLISAHHHVLEEPREQLHAHATLAKPFSREQLMDALGSTPPTLLM